MSRGEQERCFDFSALLGFEQPDTRYQANKQFMRSKSVEPAIACVAFLGDAVQVVRPIIAGYCLSLRYQLLRGPSASPPPLNVGHMVSMDAYLDMTMSQLRKACRSRGLASSGEHHELLDILSAFKLKAVEEYIPCQLAFERTQDLLSLLQRALASEAFFTKRGVLAFPCFHLYDNHELPDDSAFNDNITTDSISLKGADALLSVAAARMGLSVKILR